MFITRKLIDKVKDMHIEDLENQDTTAILDEDCKVFGFDDLCEVLTERRHALNTVLLRILLLEGTEDFDDFVARCGI